MQDNTGIGVIQQHLYPRLERLGVELHLTRPRDAHRRALGSVVALARALTDDARNYDAQLVLASPIPLRPRVPLVAFVYDLRWKHTRRLAGRSYRQWDFRRTTRLSSFVLTTSMRSHADICAEAPNAEPKIRIVRPGPGQMTNVSHRTRAGQVTLIGRAAHKRNEVAASALALSRPPWARTFVTVGVSEETNKTLSRAYPGQVTSYGRLNTEELRRVLGETDYFVLLSTSEGFGLPYVEAAVGGAQVIAIDQPLTREVLSGAPCVLLQDGSIQDIADQMLAARRTPAADSHFAQRFSWDEMAFGVFESLRDAIEAADGR